MELTSWLERFLPPREGRSSNLGPLEGGSNLGPLDQLARLNFYGAAGAPIDK